MRGKSIAVFLVGLGLGFLLTTFCVSPEMLTDLQTAYQGIASQIGVDGRQMETRSVEPVAPPPAPISPVPEEDAPIASGAPMNGEASAQQDAPPQPMPGAVVASDELPANPEVDSPGLTARQILEQAIRPEAASDPDRAAFLVEVALNKAVQKPEQFAEAWSLIQDSLPDSAESQGDPVFQDRCRTFLDKLEKALGNTGEPALFDTLWNIRTAVKARVAAPAPPNPPTESAQEVPQDVPGVTACQMIGEAIRLEKTGEPEKARFLQEVALNRARQNPEEFVELWPLFKEHTSTQEGEQGDDLAQERYWAFLEELENILATVADVALFDRLWAVRLEVTGRLTEPETQSTLPADIDAIKRLAHSCEIADITQIRGLLEGLEESPENRGSLIQLLENTIGTPDEEGLSDVTDERIRDAHESLKRILAAIITKAESRISEIENKCDAEWEKDRNGTFTDPAPQDKQGAYQSLVGEIANLSDMLSKIDIPRYESYLGSQKGPDESMLSLSTRMESVAQRSRALQHVRYNLWAVEWLNALEITDADPDGLGRIQVELLHPAVSVLYGRTYDTLLQRMSTEYRGPFVKTVLTAQKAVLDAF